MKYYRILIFLGLLNLGTSALSAAPIIYIDDTRLEVVNEQAFFILTLDKDVIKYGDKVELVFGLNHKIEVYNISGNNIHTFTNSDELVVLITPEDLRCFQNKTLRKVKVYTQSGTVSIKTNIGPDHLKIK